MRNIKHFKRIRHMAGAALMLAFAMVLAVPVPALAKADGNCSFDGKHINSDFTTEQIAKKFEDLQPGDEMSFTVKYTNNYDHDTDWYMKNIVVQTLEKADAARKQVDGTGKPESGGYTYAITHTDKKGDTEVLFTNARVGGSDAASGSKVTPGDMEGLEQATNALDEYFYIETLGYKESGTVNLYVKFEGETEVNDYMDTDGEIDLRFAVELTPEGGKPDKPTSLIKTGDSSRLLMWSAIMVAGSVMLVIAALILNKKERSTDSRETGGAE